MSNIKIENLCRVNTVTGDVIYGMALSHLDIAGGLARRGTNARLNISAARAALLRNQPYTVVQSKIMDAIQSTTRREGLTSLLLAWHEIAKQSELACDGITEPGRG